jgi:triosephosphate isomerase
MNQKPLIIANWKMNPITSKEAEHLFNMVKQGIDKIGNTEVVICPPFVYLSSFGPLGSKNLQLGGQDCFWEEKGAVTGEISPLMLKNLGCQYVILGHSERRKNFKETDEMINKKLKAALKARLKPILCIGEEARDAFDSEGRPINEMSLVVAEQLEKDLVGVAAARMRDVVIAYEPIWAIGTGNPCLPDDTMKAALFIKKTLAKLYNRPIAEKVRIIYGGSVNSANVVDYVQGARMNGVLVGGASLNATDFSKIIEKINGQL